MIQPQLNALCSGLTKPETIFYNFVTSFYTPKTARSRSAGIFVVLFHQPNNDMHIHILAFLLVIQSFMACQVDPGIGLVSEARFGLQSTAAPQSPEKARPAAARIVFKSVDGGQRWTDVSTGLPADLQVGRLFAGDDALLLGSLNGLYHSTTPPMAQTWEKVDFPVERITGVFSGQTGLYVSSYGNGFYKKLPGSDAWVPMHTALPDKTVLAVLETPDGSLFVGCDNGIYKSTDGGETWNQVFADVQVPSLVAANGVLIGGSVKGILRSTDGGEHWNVALSDDGPAFRTGLVGDKFFAITSGGVQNRLRMSADGGQTWQRMDQNLSLVRFFYDAGRMDEYLSPIRVIYDLEQVGEYLFCSNEAGIFRSADQGKTWELVHPASGPELYDLTVSGRVIFAVQVRGGC